MGDSSDKPVYLKYASLATLVLFVIFIAVCAVCVIPNLYFIEANTSDIEDNTSHLVQGGHLADLLVTADTSIKQIHEDMKVLHELLGNAAQLLIKIEQNTDPSQNTRQT